MNSLILRALNPAVVTRSQTATAALHQLLDASYGTPEYLEMVTKYEVKAEMPRLLDMALANASSSLGSTAARLVFQFNGEKAVAEALKEQPDSVITVISSVGSEGA